MISGGETTEDPMGSTLGSAMAKTRTLNNGRDANVLNCGLKFSDYHTVFTLLFAVHESVCLVINLSVALQHHSFLIDYLCLSCENNTTLINHCIGYTCALSLYTS